VIIGTKLKKSYRSEVVFEDVSFKLGNGVKVGLVGANGCGKSTLFKLIVGMEEFDSGSIHKNEDSIGYISQELDFPDVTAGEYLSKFLEHDWESYKVDMQIDKLNFKNYDPNQKISTMSEGQKMKLKMVEVLLAEPTVLLIDEPDLHLHEALTTAFVNHLRRMITDQGGQLILASHAPALRRDFTDSHSLRLGKTELSI